MVNALQMYRERINAQAKIVWKIWGFEVGYVRAKWPCGCTSLVSDRVLMKMHYGSFPLDTGKIKVAS